jgi:hypothetical protein
MSVSFLHFINRTSSGAESGSPAMYDSRRALDFDVVFVEDSGSWDSVSVVGVSRAIVVVSFDVRVSGRF